VKPPHGSIDPRASGASGAHDDADDDEDQGGDADEDRDDPELRVMRRVWLDEGRGEAREEGRDDPELRAMRQVWLEMREQEPPAGGMVDLLAAARAKAMAMQPPPPWWQRVVAALRRPPVLAFATVVVLIGGAVLFTRRLDSVPPAQVDSITSAPRADEPVMPAAEAPPSSASSARGVAEGMVTGGAPLPSSRPRGGARGPGGAATAPTAGQDPATTGEAPDDAVDPIARNATPARRAHTAESEKSRQAVPGDVRGPAPRPSAGEPEVASRELAEQKPEPPAAPAPTVSAPAAAPTRAQDGRGKDADASTGPAETTSVDEGEGGDGAERGKETQGTRERAAALAQLYRQCEAAAERGDCVVVRKLVAQITAKDSTYRSRLARDSAVARCLTR
jgi:hypothetical protein